MQQTVGNYHEIRSIKCDVICMPVESLLNIQQTAAQHCASLMQIYDGRARGLSRRGLASSKCVVSTPGAGLGTVTLTNGPHVQPRRPAGAERPQLRCG